MEGRLKSVFVAALILVPLIITAVVKYLPALTRLPKITSVAVVPPRVYAPDDFAYLGKDVAERLSSELSTVGVRVQRTPTAAEVSEAGNDLQRLARDVQADALIISAVTVDSGIIQLNLQIVDPATHRILFNTPFQSSRDRYPEMIRAAGGALQRALQP
jgi:hypothetical protein